jgi:hypothetical protein
LKREGKSVNGLTKAHSNKHNQLRYFTFDNDETSRLGWHLCEEIRQQCT